MERSLQGVEVLQRFTKRSRALKPEVAPAFVSGDDSPRNRDGLAVAHEERERRDLVGVVRLLRKRVRKFEDAPKVRRKGL